MARSVPTDAELIGRAKDVEIAELALLDAAAGRGRTLIVSGPPGVGKTALLEAITRRARALSFRVGAGTAAPVEGAWPYAPVVEALADVCRRHPTLLDGLADHHREEIDRALAGTETPWAGGSSHQRLFVAVAELVRLASGTHGLLLTIDDIHDADDASLRLLHYLSRSTASERVCIVVGHRTTPMSETLAETRHSLLDRHRAAAIELGPLNDEEIALLVARHVDDASSEQRGRITALSRGIPFAVNELARRAAAEPHWVQALDANMVTGIEPATREVLQRVAIVGSTFDTDEFVALSGVSEDVAFAHLDRALAALVVEPSSAGYRFRHAARARCAARRPPSPSPAPHPPRCCRTAHRARRLCGTGRPSPPRVRRRRRRGALSAPGGRD